MAAQNSGGQLGFMYFVRNQSADVTQGTVEWYLNSNPAIRRLDKLDGTTRYSQFYVRVRPIEVNSDTITAAQYQPAQRRNDWITTTANGSNILHRGADVFMHPGTGSTGVIDVWFTYYFSTKGPR